MKPIKDCKHQEQDYRQKMSACNVSYRHKRSGPKLLQKLSDNDDGLVSQFPVLRRICTKL